MTTSLRWLLPGLACACAGAPDLPDASPGVATAVVVLDASFVRFESQRVPVEAFLLTMRERVRAARGAAALLPAVEVAVPKDAPGVDGAWVRRLAEELHKAGVRHVAIGGD